MKSVTGIELGPDCCVLVRARKRGVSLEIAGVRIFEPAEWPADPQSRASLLQEAREAMGLPRRATVVAWNRAAFSMASGEATLREAGFVVDTVITPTDALALLAWARPRTVPGTPIAWMSINHHGAALAVVRDLEVLYSREFSWRIRAADHRAQAHLLRRYLYVAQLVPEVRIGIETVRQQHGAAVDLAITCGNIPDLRSFTIPLIEELGLEFETLDSLEGLRVDEGSLAQIAPAAAPLRLASAAAGYGEPLTVGGSVVRWMTAAVGVLLAVGAAWWAASQWPISTPRRDEPPGDPRRVVSAQGREDRREVAIDPPGVARSVRAPARPSAPSPTTGQVTPERATSGAPAAETPPPNVSGILVSSDRRLAVVDGAVVGPGDRVGSRVVIRIETDAVVFREASGRLLRIPVRVRER
jgi:hypothetical protein